MPDDEKIDLSVFMDEYLNDARTGFQKAGDALLAFENDRGRTDKLDELSRALHTLKSSSAMLEFDEIAGLAHSSEDLVGGIKDGHTPVTQEALDVLFEIVDTLERMVAERGRKDVSDWGDRVFTLKEKIRAERVRQSPLRRGQCRASSSRLKGLKPFASICVFSMRYSTR